MILASEQQKPLTKCDHNKETLEDQNTSAIYRENAVIQQWEGKILSAYFVYSSYNLEQIFEQSTKIKAALELSQLKSNTLDIKAAELWFLRVYTSIISWSRIRKRLSLIKVVHNWNFLAVGVIIS